VVGEVKVHRKIFVETQIHELSHDVQ
jgi:hypothetical protein